MLKRNAPALKDVFLLLEKQYQHKFGRERKISRLCGETEEQVVQQTGCRDVNLWEIYQAIEEISEAEREWLMEEGIRIK